MVRAGTCGWRQLIQIVDVLQDLERRAPAAASPAHGSRLARAGGTIDFFGDDLPAPYVLHGFGGDDVGPCDPTRCCLDSPGSLSCGE